MTTQNYSFILLRGLVRETEHWGPFIGLLREAFPGSEVHGLDIPGAGTHYRQKTPDSIEAMVQQMRQDLLALGDPGDKQRVLIAVSLGGMIAAQWFQHFPHDFTQGVLINTSYAQFSPPWKRLKLSALKQLITVPLLKGTKREKQILSVVSNRPERYSEVASAWSHIHEQRPVSMLNSIRQLKAAFSFQGVPVRPKLPLLLLGSQEDQMVDHECSKAIAHAWHVPLKTHATAGHDLTTDDPQWAIDQIKSWMEESQL